MQTHISDETHISASAGDPKSGYNQQCTSISKCRTCGGFWRLWAMARRQPRRGAPQAAGVADAGHARYSCSTAKRCPQFDSIFSDCTTQDPSLTCSRPLCTHYQVLRLCIIPLAKTEVRSFLLPVSCRCHHNSRSGAKNSCLMKAERPIEIWEQTSTQTDIIAIMQSSQTHPCKRKRACLQCSHPEPLYTVWQLATKATSSRAGINIEQPRLRTPKAFGTPRGYRRPL